jgi:ABC-type lipoprotein export system ATPase subunit
MLRARGLVKAYRAPGGGVVSVLNGVDLDVAGGEAVVVVGASGSGKSTLLNLLGLLEAPDAGAVWLGDREVTALGRSARARARGQAIGYVFQSFLLLPSLTALDNVVLAARYAGGDRRAAQKRGLALLEAYGVLDRRDHFPAELSGGEQQRVAFCRALLNEPPLLLADEPTGNLDDTNTRVIAGALLARAREGAAVVVVTHRPEVFAGASRTLALHEGMLAPVHPKEGHP